MANPHPIPKVVEEHPFHAKDAVTSGIQGAMFGGAAGVFGAAMQNSLAKTNVGAWGIVTRSGGTITSFTAMAAMYNFSRDASANLRRKEDTLNVTIGSFLSGATLALQTGRMPRILGTGAVFSVILTAFEYTGGTMSGAGTHKFDTDEYERKEFMRRNRRRPVEETIADLGEGRGIEPAGYEDRRRQRLKEKYGVDINPVSATPE